AAPSPVAPAVEGAPIDDEEFEALLDGIYGNAVPGTVDPAPLAATPAVNKAIDDDEFEALLDTLHGKPAAAVVACVPAAPPDAAPTPTTRHAVAVESTVRVDT